MYEGAEYQEEDGKEPREIFPGLLQGHDEHGENVVETQQFDELDPADQEKVQSLTQIYYVSFLQSRIIVKSANRFYQHTIEGQLKGSMPRNLLARKKQEYIVPSTIRVIDLPCRSATFYSYKKLTEQNWVSYYT